MILLTGATGKTGGEVARQLAAHGIPYRALVRNREKAAPLEALGAELVVGDLADRRAVDAALEGIDRAFLVTPNGEQQLAIETQFIDAAKAAGVGHVVYLSSLESVPESPNPIPAAHVAAEGHLRASGLDWTMLRPTFFMQTFTGMAAVIRDKGMIALPCGHGTLATTDLRDVAAVTVKVFTEPGHANRSYDLTGPDLLTMEQVAAVFGDVLGREVRYVDLPMEQFAARLEGAGIAPWRVDAVCKEFAAIAGGSIDHTTDVLPRLLGRPATSLRQFVEDHRVVFG